MWAPVEATLGDVPVGRSIVNVRAAGYADNTMIVNMSAEQPRQTIQLHAVPIGSTASFDPAAASAIRGVDSTAQVSLPANGLKTTAGAAPSGNVNATITNLKPGSDAANLPGDYSTATGRFLSLRAVAVRFADVLRAML